MVLEYDYTYTYNFEDQNWDEYITKEQDLGRGRARRIFLYTIYHYVERASFSINCVLRFKRPYTAQCNLVTAGLSVRKLTV